MLVCVIGLGVYVVMDAIIVVFGDFVIVIITINYGIRLDWIKVWPVTSKDDNADNIGNPNKMFICGRLSSFQFIKYGIRHQFSFASVILLKLG